LFKKQNNLHKVLLTMTVDKNWILFNRYQPICARLT
jgi:hypothetical protein